jgi:hypothetical protein
MIKRSEQFLLLNKMSELWNGRDSALSPHITRNSPGYF